MSDPYDITRSKIADALEHEDTTEPKTKRVLAYGWDSDNLQKVRVAVDSNGQVKTVGGTGADAVGVKNVAGTQINPATEEKQDSIVTTLGTKYAVKITEVGDVTYVAKAAPGSAQASAVWQAMKIDETTGVVITWADGDQAFDNSGTDLTALTYS